VPSDNAPTATAVTVLVCRHCCIGGSP
jgi:hypothetical protein